MFSSILLFELVLMLWWFCLNICWCSVLVLIRLLLWVSVMLYGELM